MSLEIDHIPFPPLIAGPEEVLEPYLVERGGGGVSGDMPADAVIDPVRAHHHGHGVPPYDASYVALYFVVARVARLVLERDGVYVRGV